MDNENDLELMKKLQYEKILRQKYRNLKYQVYNIKDKINDLEKKYISVKSSIEQTLLYDDNIYDNDNLIFAYNINNSCLDEIKNVIIPSLNEKS